MTPFLRPPSVFRLRDLSATRTASAHGGGRPGGGARAVRAVSALRVAAAKAAAALAVAAGLVATPGARAVEPLKQHDIVLLQRGEVIAQRIDGGVDAMADYLQRLGAAATDAMRANPQQIPSAGFIVVAVRPGRRTHIWLDFKPALSPATTAALTQVVETVAPMPVKSGDVVFALRVSLWSDKPPTAYAPAPAQWRDAARESGRKVDVETLVDQLWPQ